MICLRIDDNSIEYMRITLFNFIKICAVLLIFPTTIFQPLFTVYFINPNNWKIIVILQIISTPFFFFPLLGMVFWNLKSKKNHNLIQKIFLGLITCLILFIYSQSAFKGILDLLDGDENYQGQCMLKLLPSRKLSSYYLFTESKQELHIKASDYKSLKGDFVGNNKENAYHPTQCNSMVKIVYLKHLGIALSLEKIDTSQLKSGLIGVWQDMPFLAAGWSNRYHFYPDGSYSYVASLMNCERRDKQVDGIWRIENGMLVLEEKLMLYKDGGEIVDDVMCGKTVKGYEEKIISIEQSDATKRFPFISSVENKKKGERSEFIREKVSLNGEDYWKFYDDPNQEAPSKIN